MIRLINRPDNIHGVSRAIEQLVATGKPITLVLDRGAIVYERVFNPIGSVSETGIMVYRHEKNTYQVINTPDGKIYQITDRKNMPEASTISNQIYVTLRTLEKSGYKLVSSTDWKVI